MAATMPRHRPGSARILTFQVDQDWGQVSHRGVRYGVETVGLEPCLRRLCTGCYKARMTAIWRNDGSGWRLLAAAGFPDEAALHSLVEEAPQTLPLAGAPRLVMVGRQVSLGSGYADLLAVEPSGRLVIIEAKLARNAEARRAVVAQVLSYAAHLNGLDRTV